MRTDIAVPGPRALRRSLACAIGLAAAACAWAQTDAPAPLADPSLDQLRSLLSAPAAGARSRGFTPAKPPSREGACASANATQEAGAGSRRLEVVPYAGNGAASVNLAIQFATGSDTVAPASQQVLDRLIVLLKEPAMSSNRFAIAGHTDATGTAAINLPLSCARAIAVRQYLIARGIAPERVSAYGFGSSKPLDEGAIESARNRRVEIRRAE